MYRVLSIAEYLGNENPSAITGKETIYFDLSLLMQYVLHRHTSLNHCDNAL